MPSMQWWPWCLRSAIWELWMKHAFWVPDNAHRCSVINTLSGRSVLLMTALIIRPFEAASSLKNPMTTHVLIVLQPNLASLGISKGAWNVWTLLLGLLGRSRDFPGGALGIHKPFGNMLRAKSPTTTSTTTTSKEHRDQKPGTPGHLAPHACHLRADES